MSHKPVHSGWVFAALILAAAGLITVPLGAEEIGGAPKPVRRGIPTVFSGTAVQKPLPQVIQAGLDDYALMGAEGALKTWTKNGPLDGDTKVLEIAGAFHEVEKYYGRYLGFHLIQQKELTPTSRLVYLQMNYEKGPFFARFLCYQAGTEWVVAGRLLLNTDPDQVL